MITKCSCVNCGQHVEFEAEQFDSRASLKCPTCGSEISTEENLHPPTAPPSKKRIVWSAIAMVAVMALAVAAWRHRSPATEAIPETASRQPEAEKSEPQQILDAIHAGWERHSGRPTKEDLIFEQLVKDDLKFKPDPNLRDAQGSYGWQLGASLPSNLTIESNDDSLGLTCNPTDGSDVGILTLTEDKRIASIYIGANSRMTEENTFAPLREKYGLRSIVHHSSDGDYYAYFGTTNKEVILQAHNLSGFGRVVDIEYRDANLWRLAQYQLDARRRAAQKVKDDEIKSHL